MPDFQFDQSKTFSENCDDFLVEMEAKDPELGTIMRANWHQLLKVVQEGESNASERTDFHAAIGEALDALLVEPLEVEDE